MVAFCVSPYILPLPSRRVTLQGVTLFSQLSFSQLSGTFANVVSILLGGGLGLLLGRRMPERTQRTLLQTLGLVTVYIALNMAGSLNTLRAGPLPGVIAALVALALGAVAGEAMHLEEGLEQLGEYLRRRFSGSGRFTEGFLAASLLFCIGPMAIIGGLQNGLTGDSSTYMLKGTLDGIAAIALAGVYGAGVLFAALPVLVLQGGISLLAGGLAGVLAGGNPQTLTDNPYIQLITGMGGIMIVGMAVNLMLAGLGLEDRRVRLGSLLPALVIAPLLLWALQGLG